MNKEFHFLVNSIYVNIIFYGYNNIFKYDGLIKIILHLASTILRKVK